MNKKKVGLMRGREGGEGGKELMKKFNELTEEKGGGERMKRSGEGVS